MSHGLFGKLPAKRDFVAFDLPPAVLRPWETWLQGAVAGSRHGLGADWTAAFLKAPIWRFWCGANVLGRPALGALMPSVDGVGRYFPLTVLAVAGDGQRFAPPARDSRTEHFAVLEDLMLGALDPALDVDAFRQAVKALPPAEAIEGAATRPAEIFVGTGEDLDDALKQAQDQAEAAALEDLSLWWTIGGDGYAPAAFATRGLPSPVAFAGMLTGLGAREASP